MSHVFFYLSHAPGSEYVKVYVKKHKSSWRLVINVYLCNLNNPQYT